jgi:hypothetical protein
VSEPKSIRKALWILLGVSFFIRAFLAGFIDLGNDEVYYWTYARCPDWSHFDHPPMVGFLIQIFTLNLHFPDEFFLRLGPVLIGTFNTWLIFRMGKNVKGGLTGLYAALLYTASFYCSVISGTFIMPDGPQGLFWMLSLYLMLEILPDRELTRRSRRLMLLLGVVMGLAILSKYHSVFLPGGAFLFILLYNRKWFHAKETYLAFFILLILASPILIWNMKNHYISFTYHENRIDNDHRLIRWDYLGTEFLGQFFYSNPVNFVLVVLALIAMIRKRSFIDKDPGRIILLTSLPLILVVLFLSLSSPTLPHWTGPAFYGLILLTAAWLAEGRDKKSNPRLIPGSVSAALALIFLLLVLAPMQIRFGLFPLNKTGEEDFTVQLYGWRQIEAPFDRLASRYEGSGAMQKGSPLVSYRWFPAANLDYYVAAPAGRNMYAIGTLERIHKYYWIDRDHGALKKGSDAYLIFRKGDPYRPENGLGQLYDSICPADTLPILRRGEEVDAACVIRLKSLKRTIRFDSLSWYLPPTVREIYSRLDHIKGTDSLNRAVQTRALLQGRPYDDVLWEQGTWDAVIGKIPE